MRKTKFEYPPKLLKLHHRAKKLEYLSIIYLVLIIIGYILVKGNSQIIKSNMYEDILSLIPPILFLITSRIFYKKPTKDFPYGYHRIISIGYLLSALALTIIGFSLLIENSLTLLKAEHIVIGNITLFGHVVWLG